MKSDSKDNGSSGLPDPKRLREWAPELSDSQFEAVQIYIRELVRFNKTLNLVSPATLPRLDALHILDTVRAWSIVQPFIPKGSTIMDFGSGNGLPGLLSAALSPQHEFRLVDRDQRKMEFCKHAASSMGLKNLIVSCMDVGALPSGSVNFALSRGFASVTKSLLLTRSIFKAGGSFFMMKGDSWSVEVAEVPPRLFGAWKVLPVGSYRLPEIPAEFVVLQCTKLDDASDVGKS